MVLSSDSAILIEHLQKGEILVTGQFLWGSNYTFLCDIDYQGQVFQGVYKPVRGERPLWDFPSETLAGREVAAYLLSEGGNWKMVPPTVFRQDGPAGPGSLQHYVEHDPDYHFFQFTKEDKARVRPVALFDVVANNTDRKAGHILVGQEGKLWLIDHGVCFHVEPKLRTVIWDFAGLPLTEQETNQLDALRAKLVPDHILYQQLAEFLNRREIQATCERIDEILNDGVFPFPQQGRYSTPWPPV